VSDIVEKFDEVVEAEKLLAILGIVLRSMVGLLGLTGLLGLPGLVGLRDSLLSLSSASGNLLILFCILNFNKLFPLDDVIGIMVFLMELKIELIFLIFLEFFVFLNTPFSFRRKYI